MEGSSNSRGRREHDRGELTWDLLARLGLEDSEPHCSSRRLLLEAGRPVVVEQESARATQGGHGRGRESVGGGTMLRLGVRSARQLLPRTRRRRQGGREAGTQEAEGRGGGKSSRACTVWATTRQALHQRANALVRHVALSITRRGGAQLAAASPPSAAASPGKLRCNLARRRADPCLHPVHPHLTDPAVAD